MPETAGGDENETHEIDAVHAAQDLLDLSNGFDYPSSLPSHSGDANTTACAISGTPEPFHGSMADSKNMNDHSTGLDGSDMGATSLNDMQPPPNNSAGLATLDQTYGDPTNSMSFFDNPMPQFDNTPGQNPFLPDYFRNMPPFDAFFSGQATPRGIMDLSFDIDVGLTDCDLGLLDQYNFQVPFAADTPSTDAHGPDPHPSETDTAPVRAEAYKQSIWRYLPHRSRNPNAEQANLAFVDTERDSHSHITRRIVAEK